MGFPKTIGSIVETTDWIGLTAKSTKSNNFKPFSKLLSVKQPIQSIKQQVVFPLLYKAISFKKGFNSKEF